MDADLFLQQFGHLAQGEGGIKKLRDVIFQLAVRGKLVEQNPADEPAEVLLKKIRAERKSKEKPSKVVAGSVLQLTELGFPLPHGWCFDRVINLIKMTKGKKPKNLQSSKNLYPYVNIKAFDRGIIDEWTDDDTAPQCAEGDLLIVCDGSRSGYTGFAIAGVLGSTLAKIEFYAGIEQKFFKIFTDANFRKFNTAMRGAAIPHLDLPMFRSHPFPLPPLAEQKRIVAKVDELMALCDKLEAEQKAQRTLKTQAVQSTLHHLTNAENPTSLGTSLNILERTFGNWFDDLATVKHLRATILQLAVQGKLVPQTPTDEPASELLKRIEAEKKRLVKEKLIRKISDKLPISPSAHPVVLPISWQWVRFGWLFKSSEYGTSEKSNERGDVPVYSMGHIQDGLLTNKTFKFLGQDSDELPKLYLRNKDILFNRTNSYELVGKSAVYTGKTNTHTFASYLIRVELLHDFVDCYFANKYLNSPLCRVTQIEPEITNQTNQANYNGTKLQNILFPLPPLAEQKRIVTKVDELMTLCDQLEADITHTQTLNTHLMDSLIHRMTKMAHNISKEEAA